MEITSVMSLACLLLNQEWNIESQPIVVKILLEKAFEEIGIHKDYSYVFYKFMDEKSLLKRAGFIAEAIFKEDAIPAFGKHMRKFSHFPCKKNT